MKSLLENKNFLGKIWALTLLAILLFACTTSPESPQNPIPVVKPTKTKSSPLPNLPESSKPPKKTFSIQNANKVAPSDILEEVYFGGQGGGGVCEDGDFSYPTVDEGQAGDANQKAEWLAPISLVVCGWWSDSEVEITLELPDGTLNKDTAKVEETTTKSIPYIYYVYQPNADSPMGAYNFSFSGNAGSIEYRVNVNVPNDSRMYYIENIQSLYLYGFTSNEKIRLFLYNTPTGTSYSKLTAWTEYNVDSSGNLLIKINPDDAYYGNYFAIGEKSGTVGNRIDVLTSPLSTGVCKNSLPSRLEVGKYAYVATNPPLDNRVREGAGTDYSIIGYIETGNAMKILDGPKCANGWAWWKVQSIKKSDLVGWTSEGDDVYWLIPCDSLSICP